MKNFVEVYRQRLQETDHKSQNLPLRSVNYINSGGKKFTNLHSTSITQKQSY